MPQDSNAELTAKALLLVIFIIAILLYPYYAQIKATENYLSNLESGFWLYSITIIIVFVIFLFLWLVTNLSYKSAKFVSSKIGDIKNKARWNQKEAEEIESLMETKLPISQEELAKYLEQVKKKIKMSKSTKDLSSYIPELKKRLAKAIELLEDLEKKNEVMGIQARKLQVEKELQDMEEQKKERQRQEETRKWKIERDLKINDYFDPKHVFKKEKLTKKQIEVLIENGFKQINDYCIYERKFTQALVKPILNHHVVHDFLVWGAKKLLDDIKEVQDIKEHYTKDADITFKFQGRIYALEIETGTLLAKKNQLKEKLAYLNRKYPKRWMFIVSNRNLLPKYRKLGFSTPRNEVYKNLRKLLGI